MNHNFIIYKTLEQIEVKNHKQAAFAKHDNLVILMYLQKIVTVCKPVGLTSQRNHFPIKLLQTWVVELVVIRKIELSTRMLEWEIILRSRKVKPLRVSKFVTLLLFGFIFYEWFFLNNLRDQLYWLWIMFGRKRMI